MKPLDNLKYSLFSDFVQGLEPAEQQRRDLAENLALSIDAMEEVGSPIYMHENP
jgi:hypothetical protein